MLLQRLKEYADRLQLPPRLYAEAPVRYIIELDADGRLLNATPTDTANPAVKRDRRGVRRPVPEIQRAVTIKPLLLADKADYTLGYVGPDAKPDRVVACHKAYLDLLERCAAQLREPAVQAVLAFLRNAPLERLRLPSDFDPSARITFRVAGEFITDLPSVQAFWAAVNDPEQAGAPVMQCLVCGREMPVLDRLQAKIKGIPGGQTSGTAIISANAEAFESYGLSASLIAPTCADCGEHFTKAANELLASDGNRVTIGGAAFVFWTREQTDFNVRTFLFAPQDDEVRELLRSVFSGHMPSPDPTRFYAVCLSASGGRAVVRDWIDTTLGELKHQLGLWHLRLAIVGPNGEPPRPLGLYPLAAATVRDPKDLAPPVPRSLVRAALTGTPLPWDLLYQTVRRVRAERRVTHPRSALIKLVLLSQRQYHKEEEMVKLDPTHPSAAYHCGRLLAVLEQVQRQAVRGINQTIVDRYYGAASSTPARVFPTLLNGAQAHLGKLRRDRPGAHHALQQRIEDIVAAISRLPTTLTLMEQGEFALGFYHQRADDRAQAREARQRRLAGQTAPPEAELADTLDDEPHTTEKEA